MRSCDLVAGNERNAQSGTGVDDDASVPSGLGEADARQRLFARGSGTADGQPSLVAAHFPRIREQPAGKRASCRRATVWPRTAFALPCEFGVECQP